MVGGTGQLSPPTRTARLIFAPYATDKDRTGRHNNAPCHVKPASMNTPNDPCAPISPENERRTTCRVKIRARIHLLDHTNSTVSGWVKNISTGGLFVVCKQPLPKGTRCETELLVMEGETLHTLVLEGTVVHGRKNGVGVRFDDIPAASHAMIHKLVDMASGKGG